MVYKIKKSIPQYTIVDLLEILQYPSHPEYSAVQDELEKRNPTDKELAIARNGLVYRNEARNRPLTLVDYLYCLFAPLTEQRSRFTAESDVGNSFDDTIAEYEYYNESRRANQMRVCKKIVMGFWSIVGLIALLFFIVFFIKELFK